MHSHEHVSRAALSFRRPAGALLALALVGIGGGGAAQAQELVHRFINPSFGGNPFYSDHLIATASIHRPAAPEKPAAEPPTQADTIAEQLRGRLFSQISGDIQDAIEDLEPGQTRNFELGNQRITVVRTASETQVTFLNTATGETQRVVVPSDQATSASLSAASLTAAAQAAASQRSAAQASTGLSAEQLLGAPGSSLTAPSGAGLSPGLLDPSMAEIALGNPGF